MSSGEKHQNWDQQQQPQKLDLYVIARIVIVLKEKGSVNKTNLATFAGLAYDRLAKYISWMEEKKLVSTNDEDGLVSLTEEGLKSYEELVDWIMRYIGAVRFPKV
jgi:predicted transcriptional regulator